MNQLNCAAFVAGIVRVFVMGRVSGEVTAHSVGKGRRELWPGSGVLVK